MSRDREGGRGPRRVASRRVSVTVIKHLVIDATRVNLRYRGFTGEIGSRRLPVPLDLDEVSRRRLREINAIAIATRFESGDVISFQLLPLRY